MHDGMGDYWDREMDGKTEGERLIAEQLRKERTHLDDAAEFHQAFQIPIASRPGLPLADWGANMLIAFDNACYALEQLAKEARQSIEYHGAEGCRHIRVGLMAEEVAEYLGAEYDSNLVEVADGLGDIGVIADGTALSYGIPLDDVRREIHRSNMSKLDSNGKPIKRSDGKILKSERYSPPDIAAILRAASE